MQELTGETFSAKCLARANRRSEFFDDNGMLTVILALRMADCGIDCFSGKLLRVELIPGQSIERSLATFTMLPKEEIAGAASFIRACLRLDSYDRPTAKELEVHPWLLHSY